MRVLCSSVLVFEMIVIGLFVPVAILVGGYPGEMVGVLGATIALLAVAATAGLKRGWGVALGWLVQVALVAAGLLVPMMFALGGVFAVLWWAAVRYGLQADRLRAERLAQARGAADGEAEVSISDGEQADGGTSPHGSITRGSQGIVS